MKVLVIIPTYNEKENISKLITAILSIEQNADVLVVDDNSPDGTAKIIRDLAKNNERIKLIVREKKDGRGGAVLEGMRYALKSVVNYDKILEMDADFSHRPDDYLSLIEKSNEYDIVVGSRYLPNSKIINWPLRRRVLSKFANCYIRLILGVPLNDYTNGYRVYSRAAVSKLLEYDIKMKGFITLSETIYILHRSGFKFIEVPIVFVNRKLGKSNAGFMELLNSLTGIIKIRFQ